MDAEFDRIDSIDPIDAAEEPRRRKRFLPLLHWTDAELLAIYRRAWGPDWRPETLARFRGRDSEVA